jgi:hypothetical protein
LFILPHAYARAYPKLSRFMEKEGGGRFPVQMRMTFN